MSELQWAKVKASIERGLNRQDAFRLAGIPLQTLQAIATGARTGDVDCTRRWEELETWEAACVDKYVGYVQTQAEGGSLKAAQLILKAIRPSQFGSNDKKTEVTVTQAAPQIQQTGDARERVYAYALRLFSEHPEYRHRLEADLPKLLAPAVEDGEIEDA